MDTIFTALLLHVDICCICILGLYNKTRLYVFTTSNADFAADVVIAVVNVVAVVVASGTAS